MSVRGPKHDSIFSLPYPAIVNVQTADLKKERYMRWFNKKKLRPVDNGLEFNHHIRMGDAANALRQWETAAAHYESALTLKPEDSAIQIQYGHCLKEQHRFKDAERAYRNAVEADDANADAHLHMGHISKLQNHMSDAIASYKIAARLGSTTPVGEDARRELTGLGLKAPAIVAIKIPTAIAGDPAYSMLVNALKHNRLKNAREALSALPRNAPLEIRLIEAQLLHLLGRYDEAITLHKQAGLRRLGTPASEALYALYDSCSDEEKRISFATSEIKEGLLLGVSFEELSAPVDLLAEAGKMEVAYEAFDQLFRPAVRSSADVAKTAAGMKSDRGSSHFPAALVQKLHENFLDRAREMEKQGESAQATLLLDEAAALQLADASAR